VWKLPSLQLWEQKRVSECFLFASVQGPATYSQRCSSTTVNGLCTKRVEEKAHVLSENPSVAILEPDGFFFKKKDNTRCLAGDCYFIFDVNLQVLFEF